MPQNAKNVLIVEDEAPMLKVLTEKFSKEGFTVFEARDGKEGLEVALDKKPDVVLLDILMPTMDGIEMLKRLREDPWGKMVPVFLLTNLNDLEKISESVRIGISGYLVKTDWKLEDVVNKVKDKLQGSTKE
jgi:DNA-binding response OmpR family regulator